MSADPTVHPTALVEAASVGEGTVVGPFSVVAPSAQIGARCRIEARVSVGEEVVLGDEVVLEAGCQVPPRARIEGGAVLAANATLAAAPRGQRSPTVVRESARVGANATVLPGVTVGPHAIVGAGAVVTRDVPPHAVVVGNPARIVRYSSDLPRTSAPPPGGADPAEPPAARVAGVRYLEAPVFHDLRGNLTVREAANGSLPFVPQRMFLVFDVPSEEVRGEHAHRELEQLLICVRGAISVVADDGHHRQEWRLHAPQQALYLPPMVWGIQYKPTRDAVLLVLASDRYLPDDYIRDYDEFIRLAGARRNA